MRSSGRCVRLRARRRGVRPLIQGLQGGSLPDCGPPPQEELINVGQKNAALQALYDVITSMARQWRPPDGGSLL